MRQEFLDHVARRAEAAGITTIRLLLGDGGALPYDDRSFDAPFLVTVLGEMPDQDAALNELRRVLRPGGRLVVGESLAGGDPHHVWFGSLRSRAEAAGFSFEDRKGGPLVYLASFPQLTSVSSLTHGSTIAPRALPRGTRRATCPRRRSRRGS